MHIHTYIHTHTSLLKPRPYLLNTRHENNPQYTLGGKHTHTHTHTQTHTHTHTLQTHTYTPELAEHTYTYTQKHVHTHMPPVNICYAKSWTVAAAG